MIEWGSWVGSSNSRRFRLGIDFITNFELADRVSIGRRIWYEVGAAVVDNFASFTCYGPGAWAHSATSGNFGGQAGTPRVLHQADVELPKNHGAAYPVGASAELSGIDFVPGYRAVVSGTVWVPARSFDKPAAPGPSSAARIDDRRIAVSWVFAPSTASAPVAMTVVERTTDTGGWVRVAALAGNPGAWTDTGAAPDMRFEYRVRSENSAGVSAYSPLSGPVFTTPDAPIQVTALKAGADITVAWVSQSPWAQKFVVQDQVGGAWVTVGEATSGTSWVHVSPSTTTTHAYRVAAVVPGGLTGPWSTPSQTVQLLSAPYPPTGLSPAQTDATSATTLTWVHNPADTTRQTAYALRHRPAGTTVWTAVGPATSPNSSHVVSPGQWQNGALMEWQVQTRGQHADWSPWSAVSVVRTSARPVMGLQIRGQQISGPVVSVEWTFSDTEGGQQQSWWVTLQVDGVTVERLSGTDTGTRQAIFAARVRDGASVVVSGEVSDSDGVRSLTAATPVTRVTYLPPTTPLVELTPDHAGGTVMIAVDNPGGGPAGNLLEGIRPVRISGTEEIRQIGADVGGFPTELSYRNEQIFTTAGVAELYAASTVGGVSPAVHGVDGGPYRLSVRIAQVSPTPMTRIQIRVIMVRADGSESDPQVWEMTPTPNRPTGGTEWSETVQTAGYTAVRWSILGGITADSEAGLRAILISRMDMLPVDRVEVTRNRVLCADPDSESGWREITADLPPDGSVLDQTPPVGVPIVYRVEAWTASPSTAVVEETTTVQTTAAYLTDTMGSLPVRIAGNLEFSHEISRARAVIGFIGSRMPVEHTGVTQSMRVSLSGTVLPDPSVAGDASSRVRGIALADGPVCLRTPDGTRWWVSLTGDASVQHPHRLLRAVSLSGHRVTPPEGQS